MSQSLRAVPLASGRLAKFFNKLIENATNSDKAITVRRATSVVERKPHRGQCSTHFVTWSTALGVAGDAQAQNCGRGHGMRGL
jgi:hypothetical protein